MKNLNLITLTIAVITICLMTSCGKNPKFEGTWIDKKTESKVLIIKKTGDDYFVTISGEKLPAKLSDNQLIVDNDRTIAIDKTTQSIVFLGDDYISMDGSQFLGKWVYGNRKELMEITKKDTNYSVAWKSWTDGYYEHIIICKFTDGNLIGDYYGDKNNFVIKVVENKNISLSIDPFAEFEPVRNEYFSPTQTVFVVTSGDDFIGYWSDNDDPSINITKNGSNYNAVLSLGQTKWKWSAYFKNEQLMTHQIVDMGNSPILKLVTKDSILLTNFYMMGGTVTGMKFISKAH